MASRYLKFDPFTIDTENKRILRDGIEVFGPGNKHFKPLAVRILIHIVTSREIVREDVFNTLKRERDEIKGRDDLKRYISLLRRFLGKDEFNKQIRNLSKRTDDNGGGYRFVGTFRFTGDIDGAAEGERIIEQLNQPVIARPLSPIADDGLRSLLDQAESLERGMRPLAAEAVLNQCMKTGIDSRNRELVYRKLESLRSRNIDEFFNPKNTLPTTMIFDREHKGRLGDHKKSTTQTWAFQVETVLQGLARDSFLKPPEVEASNYDPAAVRDLVNQRRNLVTYASSKINPCTEDMLETLNPLFGLDIRFVYELDFGHRQRSIFTHERRGERAALVFRGKLYKSGEVDSKGRDYGILLRYRFPKEDGRQWIAFAGSSRSGSVAARILVFDREVGQQLWAHPDLKEPLESFLCVFEVSYNPQNDAEPNKIEVIELYTFPQE